MRPPFRAARTPGIDRENKDAPIYALPRCQKQDFLRRRLAAAIERGDDATATRLIAELDRALNTSEATSEVLTLEGEAVR